MGFGERRIGLGESLELLCNVLGVLFSLGRYVAYFVGWEMVFAGVFGFGRLVV